MQPCMTNHGGPALLRVTGVPRDSPLCKDPIYMDSRAQPELDVFPRSVLRKAIITIIDDKLNCKNDLPMLPKLQFSIRLITWALLTRAAFEIVLEFTMAWLYIKLIREGDSNEPTGDPVDSESEYALIRNIPKPDGLVLAELGYPT